MRTKVRRNAFSLLELLAVVVLLGIIAMVVIPRINFTSATAKENACFQNKSEINTGVEKFRWDSGALPTDLTDLDDDAYFPDGIPVCPVSGNAYTLDATTKRVTGHATGSHP
jgi:prepilin-type N-terminal cleavage/methylation domain-containing protein